MNHPTEDELYNYVFDQTPPADPTHLALCPTCCQTVEELTRLAKVLTTARLSQPSPAQSERCVALFTARADPAASNKAGRGIR